jgi:hypothetical protein
MLRILLIINFLLIFSNGSFGINPTTEPSVPFNTNLPDLDRFFLKSSNSPNYYVIHQEDLSVLKNSLDEFQNTADSLINSLQENEKLIKDSLVASKTQLEDVNAKLISKSNADLKSGISNQYKEWGTSGSIIILLALSILLGSKYLKIKFQYQTDLDSLLEIEKQYQVYKSNTVERERKYLREIIDLKNRLEAIK